jgi:ADP-ribose pyrophosphatase YjhB (NUDIX family)
MDNTQEHQHTNHQKKTTYKNARAGVIPYTVTETGLMLFLLGQDNLSRDISDWGGSIETGETPEEAASRELKEESLGIIDIPIEELKRSYNIHDPDNQNTIFFVYIPCHLALTFPSKFMKIKKTKSRVEMHRVKLYLLGISTFALSHPFVWQFRL